MDGYTTIEIFCDNPVHAETRWVIDEFAQGGPGEWLPTSQLPGGKKLWRPAEAYTPIDTATDRNLRADLTPPWTVRDRHKFECRKCRRRGVRVRPTEARDEQLAGIFDTLIANGITTIRLTELSARLRRNADR